jgi:hypothetical protein
MTMDTLITLIGVNIFILVGFIISCGIWVCVIEDRLRNIEKGLKAISVSKQHNQPINGNNQTDKTSYAKHNSPNRSGKKENYSTQERA